MSVERKIKISVLGRSKPARLKVTNENVWEIVKLSCVAHGLSGPTQYSLQKQGTTMDDDDLISNHLEVDTFILLKELEGMDMDEK